MAKIFVAFVALLATSLAEPPVSSYLPPGRSGQEPSSQYGAPDAGLFDGGFGSRALSRSYGPPSNALDSYNGRNGQAPSNRYGPPENSFGNSQPSSTYGVPEQGRSDDFDTVSIEAAARFNGGSFGGRQPSSRYGPPSARFAGQPSQTYGAPARSNGNGARFGSPSSTYGAPSRSNGNGARFPSSSYNAPARTAQPSSTYGAPARSAQPSSTYGAPARSAQPSSTYGAPARSAQPSSTYGAPARSAQPSSTYGAPDSFQPSSRGFNGFNNNNNGFNSNGAGRYTDAIPRSYGAPSNGAGRSSFSAPSTSYGAPSNGYNGGFGESYSAPANSYSAPSNSLDVGYPSQPSSQYGPPGYARKATTEDPLAEPANYEYNYEVKDEEQASGAEFGHQESREDESARGVYHVLLPDGRMQIVEYEADEEGYRPNIRYEETGYPDSRSGPSNGGY